MDVRIVEDVFFWFCVYGREGGVIFLECLDWETGCIGGVLAEGWSGYSVVHIPSYCFLLLCRR